MNVYISANRKLVWRCARSIAPYIDVYRHSSIVIYIDVIRDSSIVIYIDVYRDSMAQYCHNYIGEHC